MSDGDVGDRGTKTIEVTGCSGCPFSKLLDRATVPWWCRIAERGWGEASLAPDWCPLRTADRIVKLKEGGGW